MTWVRSEAARKDTVPEGEFHPDNHRLGSHRLVYVPAAQEIIDGRHRAGRRWHHIAPGAELVT